MDEAGGGGDVDPEEYQAWLRRRAAAVQAEEEAALRAAASAEGAAVLGGRDANGAALPLAALPGPRAPRHEDHPAFGLRDLPPAAGAMADAGYGGRGQQLQQQRKQAHICVCLWCEWFWIEQCWCCSCRRGRGQCMSAWGPRLRLRSPRACMWPRACMRIIHLALVVYTRSTSCCV